MNTMLKNYLVWGSTREGMSLGGNIAEAALLSDGRILLVSQGSVDRNSLPPGFVRYLSDDERQAQGIRTSADIMRLGRKWNPGIHAKVSRANNEPYYRQFSKSRF